MISIKKLQLWISFAMRVSLLGAIVLSIIENQWMVLFVTVVVLILTFLPAIIEKNFNIYLPTEFELVIILFTYATLYLGEVKKYYAIFWWWDVLLHGFSAFVLGLAGFLIVYTLNKRAKVNLHMSPGFVFLFSFSFAIMIGAIWEIFEFAMDSFFRMNMQKTGLVDTMWDLIVDSIGAFLASLIGYLYIKGGEVPIFSKILENFVNDNPDHFK